ncbi:hypothetical protein B7494_g5198 [Chlorociboria aeruginascens]|nr:hypothetical protein B7494_g5198 [Chlorociboria aeruginascens]
MDKSYKPFFERRSGKKDLYWDKKLSCLKVIHVAGTKGKGGTCAFVDSFLRAHGERTGFPEKVGLYTSPPISCIRDTIRINFTPIPESIFATHFYDIWEKLSSHALQNSYRMPGYLQLLTLLSIHIFMKEGVNVAIYETHSGGEYDATNIVQPLVTGITTIGIDHVETLGPTIKNIAWHKGGIMKPGVPSFSSPQVPAVTEALQYRAVEKNVKLEFITINPVLPERALALSADVQRVNASLALELTRSFLEHTFKENHD